MLTFRTGNQAIVAKHVLSRHVIATRNKICEYRDRPVVLFQTEEELDETTCTMLARVTQPVSTVFNLTEEQGRLYARLVAYCEKNHICINCL
jgi:hypothetical protein